MASLAFGFVWLCGRREHRALAGLSLGGRQPLNVGLSHLDTFGWVGGFSSIPNTKPPAQVVPAPAYTRRRMKLLWLSCGNKDGLIGISEGMHANLPHAEGRPTSLEHGFRRHDAQEWRANLYHLVQRVLH